LTLARSLVLGEAVGEDLEQQMSSGKMREIATTPIRMDLATLPSHEMAVIEEARPKSLLHDDLCVRLDGRDFAVSGRVERESPWDNARNLPARHLEHLHAQIRNRVLGVDGSLRARPEMLVDLKTPTRELGHLTAQM